MFILIPALLVVTGVAPAFGQVKQDTVAITAKQDTATKKPTALENLKKGAEKANEGLNKANKAVGAAKDKAKAAGKDAIEITADEVLPWLQLATIDGDSVHLRDSVPENAPELRLVAESEKGLYLILAKVANVGFMKNDLRVWMTKAPVTANQAGIDSVFVRMDSLSETSTLFKGRCKSFLDINTNGGETHGLVFVSPKGAKTPTKAETTPPPAPPRLQPATNVVTVTSIDVAKITSFAFSGDTTTYTITERKDITALSKSVKTDKGNFVFSTSSVEKLILTVTPVVTGTPTATSYTFTGAIADGKMEGKSSDGKKTLTLIFPKE